MGSIKQLLTWLFRCFHEMQSCETFSITVTRVRRQMGIHIRTKQMADYLK